MARATIDSKEYLKWHTPFAAVGVLCGAGMSEPNAKGELIASAVRGALRAVAYQAITEIILVLAGDDEETEDFALIPRARWRDVKIPSAFWTEAEITFSKQDTHALSFNGATRCTGVRFDPIGVAAIGERFTQAWKPTIPPPPPPPFSSAPPPIDPTVVGYTMRAAAPKHTDRAVTSIVEASAEQTALDIQPNKDVSEDFLRRTAPALFESAPTPRSDLPDAPLAKGKKPPKLMGRELDAWVAEFGRDNPDATFGRFKSAAELRFPNRQVTERPLKASIAKLGFSKSRGNPAITRKKR